ncbi:MAG: NAD-dependent epimerase/dehydratase family protein, partial [Candidatus Velthaea sp.]
EAGHEVRIFENHTDRRFYDQILQGHAADPRIAHVTGDIVEPMDVERAVDGCAAVVHLAGVLVPYCRADPIRGAKINVLGTLNVFESAKKFGVRGLAYASSVAVFGPTSGITPEPTTQYGAFKLCNEGNARAYWLDAKLRSVGLRPFTVYGPGRETGITAGPTIAMRQAVKGEPYTIPFTGQTGMDFVGDTATIFARAATEPPEGAFAFSLQGVIASTDDIIVAVRDIVPDAQIDAAGPPLPFAPELDEGDLRRVFPGLPQTSLADGTRATIDFYRRHAALGRS